LGGVELDKRQITRLYTEPIEPLSGSRENTTAALLPGPLYIAYVL
jgi:hypothetical protein